MKRGIYELSITSQDPSNGIINKGFEADYSNVTGENTKTKITPADETKNKKMSTENIGNDDIYCGVGSCRPSWVQGCKNMVCFSVVFSFNALVTSSLSVYINSQITTLEKHFNLSSSMSGFIMSCNDLGYLTTTLFISYYTRRVHIPRVLAVCSIVYGLAGLLCTVPFFGTRDYLSSPTTDGQGGANLTLLSAPTQTCQNLTSPNATSCQNASTGPKEKFAIPDNWRTAAIAIIAMCMIVQGIAKSPRQAFMGTYVDDNVPKTKTSLYLGIITGIMIFGPVLAYSLGGVFSSIYITLEETSFSPRDPRWLGAWWLGFLTFGIVSFFVAVPLLFFPKRMHIQRNLETIKKEKTDKKGVHKLWHDFQGLLKSVFYLTMNPVFVCQLLANGLNLMAVSGLMAFMPKYLEKQFTITSSEANLMFGTMNILTAPIGTIVGGFVTSRFKISPKSCLKLTIVATTMTTVISSLGFVLGCSQPVLNMGVETNSSDISQCVQGCNCDDKNYFPVCGGDGRSYFSPCHAGCTSMSGQVFTKCGCLASSENQTVTGGLCEQSCNNLYPFLSLSVVGSFISCIAIMPCFIVLVRCVKEEDKPFAIGLSAFVGTLLGWFPGPIIYGTLIDTTCKLWKATCSSSGECTLYDIELFRFRIHALTLGLRATTILLYIIALLFAVCSRKFIFQPHEDEIFLTTVDKDTVKSTTPNSMVHVQGTEETKQSIK